MRYSFLVLAGLLVMGCATTGRMNKISVGMTKEQVIAAMGQPASTRATAGVEYLEYKLRESGDLVAGTWTEPTREYYVRLRDGHVDAYGKMGDIESTKGSEEKPDLNIQQPPKQ
jgi:hypothetical protein